MCQTTCTLLKFTNQHRISKETILLLSETHDKGQLTIPHFRATKKQTPFATKWKRRRKQRKRRKNRGKESVNDALSPAVAGGTCSGPGTTSLATSGIEVVAA